ncbi:putative disease resistance protein At3g14460 [Vicia villosa]|uniref:putative disease resistance protein At3g14460 n=1 Tax=Vicia villosa TaxID=3911 RepID=UPI00273B48F1|nr:putative disease resistance protein At3g14460 [Vicia villosa]
MVRVWGTEIVGISFSTLTHCNSFCLSTKVSKQRQAREGSMFCCSSLPFLVVNFYLEMLQLVCKFNAKLVSQERMRSACARNRLPLNPTSWDITRFLKLQKHCIGLISHQVETDISSIREETDQQSSLSVAQATAPVLPLTNTLDIREETPSIDSSDDQETIFDTLCVSNASKLLSLPHNLQSLEIEGCASLGVLPDDLLDGAPDLKELQLIDCSSLISIPYLMSLTILLICGCRNLEFSKRLESREKFSFIHCLLIGRSCDSLTTLTLDLFPRLKMLSIWICLNLVSLNVTGEEYIGGDLPLESLDIFDCPGLKSFPDERFHTPKLHTMSLSSYKSLCELPKFMNSPASLRTLSLARCPNIEIFPDGGLPSSLFALSITDCDKLTPQQDWGLENTKSLDRFNIKGCIGLESFPEEKLHLRNIFFLHISNLKGLKKLDDKGFQHLNALRELAVSGCDELCHLPEQGLPSSLVRLYVKDCPKLTPSLKPTVRKCWNKVAHIQYIEIDDQIYGEPQSFCYVSLSQSVIETF